MLFRSGCSLNACGLDANRRFCKKGCSNAGAVYYATSLVGAGPDVQVASYFTGTPPNVTQLNSTSSKTTAFSCSNPSGTGINPANPIDFASVVSAGLNVPGPAALTNIPANIINSTVSPLAAGVFFAERSAINDVNAPVLLTPADINICSGLARSQITHKVFGYAGYDWMDHCYTPFVGFLWEVEFAQGSSKKKDCSTTTSTSTSSNSSCNKGCNFNNAAVDFSVTPTAAAANGTNCKKNKYRGGVNLWGIGLKGGFSF